MGKRIFSYLLSFIALSIFILEYFCPGYNLIDFGFLFVFPMIYLMQSLLSKKFISELLICYIATTFIILIPLQIQYNQIEKGKILIAYIIICIITFFIKNMIKK